MSKIFIFAFLIIYTRTVAEMKPNSNSTKSVKAEKGLKVENATEMKRFLLEYNRKLGLIKHIGVAANWNFSTNITKENYRKKMKLKVEFVNFTKRMATKANAYNWRHNPYLEETEIRQFETISNIGFQAVKDESKTTEMMDLSNEISHIYNRGKVCFKQYEKGCLELEPGLTSIMANSRDPDELLYVWKGWRNETGRKMKLNYARLVESMNRAISLNGFNDTGEYWRSLYGKPSFENNIKRLFQDVQPLYKQLHAYVRRKLQLYYGTVKFSDDGHIPAHLLGNMWSQNWNNIYDIVKPYPNVSDIDLTHIMISKKYNTSFMFKVAEDFFTSIGFEPVPKSFWSNSMLEKPNERKVICHASAYDFFNGEDFRIRQCTTVTAEQLRTVHHEIGHVFYFMSYRRQPVIFRTGANPGFHEGMADIASLSFQTPEHLEAIGLLQKAPTDTASDMNFLMKMALGKVAFLPFAYLMDLWRWSVFRGDVNKEMYNTYWWELRCKLQGISPPVKRSENDFDPGAKHHIASNIPYIRYFISNIIQFQWHKALCAEIGFKGPLHRCSIYKSKKAGAKLRSMLELGSSKPWQYAMEIMTGEPDMSSVPLREYFQPLLNWLTIQNKGVNVGWSSTC